MVMVGLISVVTIPLMLSLSSYETLAQYPGYEWNQYTLGNIGGSDSFCAQSTFAGTHSAMTIECPTNSVIDLDAIATNTDKLLLDYGIIPNTADINTYCTNAAFAEEDTDNCSHYMKDDVFMADLNACAGQQTCQLSSLDQYVWINSDTPAEAPASALTFWSASAARW